jgi:hypothetical protein
MRGTGACNTARAGSAALREAIERYLGQDSLSRFEAKRQQVMIEFEFFKQEHSRLFAQMEKLAGSSGRNDDH